MDYEKKYKEALERAKEQAIDGYLDAVAVSDIFPELAESEDERMKEAVIATIHLYYGEPLEDEAKEMITWVERQGEHWKPSDEQMEVLKSSTYCQNEKMSKVLFGLYQDLKKLREE